ncbi:MAG: nucleotidyltransferase family protein [Fimbriimonadaceae bacterium]|nr:nucleotidyltransferase family protein [Fimbriimonadaceae bacterium]
MPTAVLVEWGELDDDLASRAPAPGLLPLAGRPLVQWAAETLRACGDVDRLVLSGPPAYAAQTQALDLFDDAHLLAARPAARLEALLEYCAGDDELLLWPTNSPLLRVEMVEQFLTHAPLDAAVAWTMVRQERFEQTFPGLRLSGQRLGGDLLAPGLLGLVRPAELTTRGAVLRRLLASDNPKTELGRLLGVGFAIKFGAGRATLEEVVRRVGEAIGLAAVVQVMPHAELAFAVRSRQAHQLARQRLEA